MDEERRRRRKRRKWCFVSWWCVRAYHLSEKGVEHVLMTPIKLERSRQINSNCPIIFVHFFFSDVTIMLTHEQQQQQIEKTTTFTVGNCDDLAKLSLLTEDILLEHLKHRYERDLIYVSDWEWCSHERERSHFFRLIWEIFSSQSIHSTKQISIRHR